ncbi:putative phosphatidate cytidylyltransferase-like protein [Trypanosoma grayi]|uniref:putative phosphatidate cytidylyltransferase-like protein n=1 Tax=Trypanosoma grayi TaxID=71804 RepID=UPI0004F467C6|nr:putative phosphatidate cytidylyltransferase-like protein [Trypanosoma grayi]KEG08516.1 putative phosphatidate cytidylyltransferase-like protein [Trypanosoma grayi]
MAYRPTSPAEGTAKILSSNIHTMTADKNLRVRSLTIALVGPTAVALAAYNKYTCTLLIWVFFFFGMLEWSGIKRHIKVALLMNCSSSSSSSSSCNNNNKNRDHEEGCKSLPKDYATPVAPHNMVVIIKTVLSSCVAIAACTGSEGFLLFLTLYLLVWTLLTLCGQHSLDMKVCQAKLSMNSIGPTEVIDQAPLPSTETVRLNLVQSFLREEFRMIAERQPTELLLNFCLEYFGFVWITGVTYPLLIYDSYDVGRSWILASLVGNFAVDIMALLVGRALRGRTRPLCLAISPQKSMEGAVAGVIANAVVFASIIYFTCRSSNEVTSHWNTFPVNLVVGLILGLMGVVGDLLQSLLKRTARVKDSGFMMPGHGGVLDRIDGLLIVFPTMFFCFRVIQALP